MIEFHQKQVFEYIYCLRNYVSINQQKEQKQLLRMQDYENQMRMQQHNYSNQNVILENDTYATTGNFTVQEHQRLVQHYLRWGFFQGEHGLRAGSCPAGIEAHWEPVK